MSFLIQNFDNNFDEEYYIWNRDKQHYALQYSPNDIAPNTFSQSCQFQPHHPEYFFDNTVTSSYPGAVQSYHAVPLDQQGPNLLHLDSFSAEEEPFCFQTTETGLFPAFAAAPVAAAATFQMPTTTDTDYTRHSTSPLPPLESDSERRAYEDRVLLEGRRRGWSYKKIKKHYGFHVEEPTLRGRLRQLTLPPQERARRPAWSDRDVQLLLEATPLYRKETGRPKVLWEAVGKYIYEHGGSRKFAGKTCHAKYKEKTGSDF
ncbi:hypothetical protein ED733_003338 [Metarhizium rileyi]|uniref:Myb-like domain-containing protein n=1 Tax=Metarhizium rileyi (strain RCEF 4871) TaxID=1649241 RepID=A0A5C6G6J3_METRR|nr:hypothetical protein ED733_003338 [Metarhizium rileyi]